MRRAGEVIDAFEGALPPMRNHLDESSLRSAWTVTV
jgi:hypothetical protein